MIIEFPEYTPDLPAINNQGLIDAKNVKPLGRFYGAVKSVAAYSNAIEGTPHGFLGARDPNSGDAINFAGSVSKLYRLDSAVFSNISKVGGYSLNTDENWSMTQYGDKIIAVTITEAMQKYQIGVDALFSNLTSDVTAPKARYVTTVKDFVLVGNTVDSVDGVVPHRVRWCGLAAPSSWTVSATTQADYQDLDAKDGWITGVVGMGDYAIIFQENAITRMDYVGSPAIFQFNKLERNRGTRVPRSIVSVGNQIYYYANDGFYKFENYNSTPIGQNKVDKTFYNDFNTDFFYRVSAAIDYANRLIVWSYNFQIYKNHHWRNNK